MMHQEPTIADFLTLRGFHCFPLERTQVGHLSLVGYVDERPIAFVLDTGASSTFVELSYCRAEGIAVTDTGKAGHGGNVHALGDVQLSVGGLPLRTDGVFAVDMSATNQRLMGKGFEPIRAVIGQDVLQHHQAVIDYAALTLFLAEAASS